MTHEPEPDPLARLLRPLTDEQWLAEPRQSREHQERLRAQLERLPRPRSRWTLFWSALAGGLLVTVLLAATGGVQFLQRLFGIEVVEVERDLAGRTQGRIRGADGKGTTELFSLDPEQLPQRLELK